MKKIRIAIVALLVLSVGVLPAVAVGGAESGEGVNTIRKFTPVIDGVIEDEYYSSFHMAHELPSVENVNADDPYTTYYDENGFVYIQSGKYTFLMDDPIDYGFDIEATSYIVYDEENLYIAVEVTDDDYGCLPEDCYPNAEKHISSYEIGPMFQDGVGFGLSLGESQLFVFCSRDGKAITPGFGKVFVPPNYYNFHKESYYREQHEISWIEIDPWLERDNNIGKTYYKASETENGYIIEACLKINESVREELLSGESSFGFGLGVCDAMENSLVKIHSQISETECMCLTHLLDDYVFMHQRNHGDENGATLKISFSDEEAFVIPPYDLTVDGVFDTMDLTRLMRYIAGDAEATVAQSADINGDGTVDVKDLTRMMKLLAAV